MKDDSNCESQFSSKYFSDWGYNINGSNCKCERTWIKIWKCDKDIFDLRDYYSRASKELKMLLAIVIAKVASTTLSLIKIESSQEYKFLVKI